MYFITASKPCTRAKAFSSLMVPLGRATNELPYIASKGRLVSIAEHSLGRLTCTKMTLIRFVVLEKGRV